MNFSKLFYCLDTKSNPPIISSSDVYLLHRILDRVLIDAVDRKIIQKLKELLIDYEKIAGISVAEKDPPVLSGNARMKAKVLNAHNGSPLLKRETGISLFGYFFKFRGTGKGSIIFFWDFAIEFFQEVLDTFVYIQQNNLIEGKLKIVKVEVNQQYQIDIDLEIIDPELLQATQQHNLCADDIAFKEESLNILIIKIDRLIGSYAQIYLTNLTCVRTFMEYAEDLIAENKLHCFDISCIQVFLCNLATQTYMQNVELQKRLSLSLKESQDYEPLPCGCPLPSVKPFTSRSQSANMTVYFLDIFCVSYEVMMTLKHILSQFLQIETSEFQYTGWSRVEDGCYIVWNVDIQKLSAIKNILRHQKTMLNRILKLNDKPEINDTVISFRCKLENTQMLLNGSPLLIPDLEGTVF